VEYLDIFLQTIDITVSKVGLWPYQRDFN